MLTKISAIAGCLLFAASAAIFAADSSGVPASEPSGQGSFHKCHGDKGHMGGMMGKAMAFGRGHGAMGRGMGMGCCGHSPSTAPATSDQIPTTLPEGAVDTGVAGPAAQGHRAMGGGHGCCGRGGPGGPGLMRGGPHGGPHGGA